MLPRPLRACIAAALLLSLVMVPIPWGDSVGSVFGAISFLCEGDWDFDEFPFLYEESPRGDIRPDALLNVHPGPEGDALFSFTGLGVKLANLPATALIIRPWWGEATELLAVRTNQISGLFVLVGILWFGWGILRRQLDSAQAPWALGALFFGTTLWPASRQTMWSNDVALLGVSGFLWVLLGVATKDGFRSVHSSSALRSDSAPMSLSLSGLAGLTLGWAVMTRPSVLVLVGPLAIVFLTRLAARSREFVVAFLLGGLPFALLLALDNLSHTGSIWTPPFLSVGAAISERMGSQDTAFSGGLVAGLLGSLASPSRGLLVYSPFLLLAPLGLLTMLRRDRGYAAAIGLGLSALFLLNASYTDWWGAACWGPRRLTEALPLLVLLSFLGAQQLPEGLRQARVFPILVGLAIAVQAVGFFLYDSSWDAEREPTQQLRLDGDELRYMSRASAEDILWSWSESPVVDALRTGEVQFGLDTTYSLAAGSVVPAPMPACSVLRTVDRFP